MLDFTCFVYLQTLNSSDNLINMDQGNCCLRLEGSEYSEIPLLRIKDLPEIERIQLRYISWNTQLFCRKHLNKRIELFMNNERCCADPLTKHKTPIKKNLITISKEMYEAHQSRLKLIPGRKLCLNCWYTSIPAWCDEHQTPESQSSDSSVNAHISPPFMDSQNEIEDARSAIGAVIAALELPPFDRAQQQKKQYLGEKYEEIVASIKTKFKVGEQYEPGPTPDAIEAAYFREMMDQLKERFFTCTSNEKFLTLSVLLISWTAHKLHNEFNVGYYHAQTVKKLVSEQGILTVPPPRRGKVLSNQTVKLIEEFYNCEEVSRSQPGMRDYITCKVDGRKIQLQKRLMLCTIKEAYCFFKERYPNEHVGLSKFTSLRPSQCILPNASGAHSVCVCVIHQNMKLLLNGLDLEALDQTGEQWSYKDILKKMICSPETIQCGTGKCESCPGPKPVVAQIEMLLRNNFIASVAYKQWTQIDRSQLETIVKTREEVIEFLGESLVDLLHHDFLTKQQSQYLRELKEQLEPDSVVIIGDFSENYSFIIQDAIQGYHWAKDQAAVHPWVCYYRQYNKSNGTSELKHFSLVMVSDYLKHDVATIATFQNHLMNYVKTKLPSVKKVIYFSDGAGSQYKNKNNLLNVCLHEHDHGIPAEWHFFTSYHGKSACDGVGGSFKRSAANTSLRRPWTNHIVNVKDLHNWAQTSLSNMPTILVTQDEIQETESNQQIRFNDAKTIAGTRGYHCFIPVSTGSMMVKQFSASEDGEIIRITDDLLTLSTVKSQVIVVLNGHWWLATIEDKNLDGNEFSATLMEPHGPADSYKMSDESSSITFPFRSILCEVVDIKKSKHGIFKIPKRMTNSIRRKFTDYEIRMDL